MKTAYTKSGQELRFLSAADILNIPDEHLPLLVLSDVQRSWLAAAIKDHQQGGYNHLMWMHRRGYVASQDLWFKERPVQDYLQAHRLKFWWNPHWSKEQRNTILEAINRDLGRPWYQRSYDVAQILGIVVGMRGFVQIPGLRICSDYADYVGLVDPEFKKGKHLSPPDANRWLKKNREYQVYGRFDPDVEG